MKPLNVLPKFENHFANQTVRFQVQLEADGYFLLRKFSSLQSQQAGQAGTTSQVLNLIFYKSSFKTLVGLRPNPIFRTKLRWPCILADAEWANFLGEKFVLWKSALIHPISHQTGTITSGFEGKKRKYHFLKIWVLLWYALFGDVHRTEPTVSGLLPQNRTCQVLKILLKVW